MPEDQLRRYSSTQPGGYQQGPSGWGTSTNGTVELLDSMVGIRAQQRPGLGLEGMRAELARGNQVLVSHRMPTGSNHMVVVNSIRNGPDGRPLITFDDPLTGTQRQETATWWNRSGNHNGTVVASRGD